MVTVKKVGLVEGQATGLVIMCTGLDFEACTWFDIFSANCPENCSEADSGRPWGSRGKFKTVQAF